VRTDRYAIDKWDEDREGGVAENDVTDTTVSPKEKLKENNGTCIPNSSNDVEK